jgi:flagellar biosynthetic protein FlhB
MAEEQQEQDRSEQASPYKLREARNRGQVAKSLEVNSLLIMSAGLAMLYFFGENFIEKQLAYGRDVFGNAHRFSADPSVALGWFEASVHFLVDTFWPLLAAVVIVGILANMFQTGPVFSFFPIKPDFTRLNPVAGFKRLFSKKMIFESIKTFIKLAVFAIVIYACIVAVMPAMYALMGTSPDSYAALLLEQVRTLIYQLLLVVLLIAVIDLAYTKWDFSDRMRMSRREVKEEVKRREGDPQIRGRRRELQKEALKRAASVQKVPDADVLITNPTHLAVALKYQREKMGAPQVIAKGAGEVALKMREIARLNGVAVVENKPLARELFKRVEMDRAVPEDLFPVVAKILAWVYVRREKPAAGLA